eukprot:9469346-Pyramimonas_sp.AAC.2
MSERAKERQPEEQTSGEATERWNSDNGIQRGAYLLRQLAHGGAHGLHLGSHRPLVVRLGKELLQQLPPRIRRVPPRPPRAAPRAAPP